MNVEKKNKIQEKLDKITRKFWYYLIILLLWFFIPLYVSENYDYTKITQIMNEALMYGLVPYTNIQPILHIIIVINVICIFVFKNKFKKIFNCWVAVNFLLVAFLQNIVLTSSFGLVILTSNLVLFVIVGIFWIWEFIVSKNDYEFKKVPLWKYWVVPLAVLAFWLPVDRATGLPDFNPWYLLYSDSALASCLITPIYLAVISFILPKINKATIRTTSFIGIIYGILNVGNIFSDPAHYWWVSIVHIPLLSISLYCFFISIKKNGV